MRERGWMEPQDMAWLEFPEARRRVFRALAAEDAAIGGPEGVATGAHWTRLRQALARYLLASAPTPEWSVAVGFALDTIPDWIETSRREVRAIYAAQAGAFDLGSRLARAIIDRAMLVPEDGTREALLLQAREACERDIEAGRTRGLAAMQRARIALLRGDRAEAADEVERAYQEHPHATDGFSHLAWIERRRGATGAMFSWLRRDADAKRQGAGSRRQRAALLALHGRWAEALEVAGPAPGDGDWGAREKHGIVQAIVAPLEVSWARHGLSRNVEQLLRRCLDLLRPVGRGEAGEASRVLERRVRLLLGEDRAVWREAASPDERGALGTILAEAGEVERALRFFSGIEELAAEKARSARALAWALAACLRGDAAGQFCALVDRRQASIRGLRSHVGAKFLARLEHAWRRDRGVWRAREQEVRECRAWLEADREAGRADAGTHESLAVLDYLAGRPLQAEERLRAVYDEDAEFSGGYGRLGMLAQAAGRWDEAEAWSAREEATGRPPKGALLTGRAAGFAWRGDWGRARKLAMACAAQDPAYCAALTLVAEHVVDACVEEWSLDRELDKLPGRMEQCLEFCRLDADSPRSGAATHLAAAKCELLRGNEAAALAWVDRHYAADPTAMDARFALGAILGRKGEAERWQRLAERDFEEGRLGAANTRRWLRQIAFTRSRDARRAAISEINRLRRPAAQVRRRLHAIDPYEGFEHDRWPPNTGGWHSEAAIFGALIAEIRPELIIEVGAWRGGSGIHMANCCRQAGLTTTIVCVDTWLGGTEFWLYHEDAERYQALGLRHGFPTVYYQFLANCVHSGCADIITPFPQTSAAAALWFSLEGFVADLVYIDASHAYDDVRRDVSSYWDLLSEGGVMFGDDHAMPDVAAAVHDFAREAALPVETRENCWVLRKPGRTGGCRP